MRGKTHTRMPCLDFQAFTAFRGIVAAVVVGGICNSIGQRLVAAGATSIVVERAGLGGIVAARGKIIIVAGLGVLTLRPYQWLATTLAGLLRNRHLPAKIGIRAAKSVSVLQNGFVAAKSEASLL